MKPYGAFVVAIILLYSGKCDAYKSTPNKDHLEFINKVLTLSEQIERDPVLKAEWEARVVISDRTIEAPPVEFTCEVETSATNPTSVHMVRPSDIRVVAAFGDSITAGNGLGARNLPEVAMENRGESWSIGGDRSLEEGVITIPNIIKKFNPALKGYSMCVSGRYMDRAWFNVAQPGGKHNHMPSQARELIDRMKNDSRVNYNEDWKLLTMFVGGNDLCGSCRGGNTAEQYYTGFEMALTMLVQEMPRTIVNLVSMFDVTPLQNMSTGLACDLLQWGFCDCARNWSTIHTMRPLQLAYSEKFELLANDTRFQTNDFTVILQPHMRDMMPPMDNETGQYPPGYLSPDCFHPTRISHQGFAVHLWNTMLTPVGMKPVSFDASIIEVPIFCPTTEFPYIFTYENSKIQDVDSTAQTVHSTAQTVGTTAAPPLSKASFVTAEQSLLVIVSNFITFYLVEKRAHIFA